MTDLVDLDVGDHAIAFAPEIGGSIASWTRRGVPILRPLPAGRAGRSAIRAASAATRWCRSPAASPAAASPGAG